MVLFGIGLFIGVFGGIILMGCLVSGKLDDLYMEIEKLEKEAKVKNDSYSFN